MRLSTSSLLLLAGSVLPLHASQTYPKTSPEDMQHQDMRHHFVAHRATQLEGIDVQGHSGKKVAALTDLLVAPIDGHVCYAIVDLEGTDGTREGNVIVPFSELEIRSATGKDEPYLKLSCTPEELALAPAYEDGSEMKRTWCATVAEHYSNKVAGASKEASGAISDDVEARPASAYKPDGGLLVRCSKLMKHGVQGASRGEDPERIGEIDEIVIDSNHGRIAYCAVGVGGFLGLGEKSVAIPYGALTVREKADSEAGDREWIVSLPATKETFAGAPEYDDGAWTKMSNPTFLTKTYSFFHVSPYWEDMEEHEDAEDQR